MSEIKLDGPALQEALHLAIVRSIDDATKMHLVEEAVKYLTTPREGYGGRNTRTPLQEALHSAASRYAETLIKEKIATDPKFTEGVESIYREAMTRLFDVERPNIVDRLARKSAEAFTSDR